MTPVTVPSDNHSEGQASPMAVFLLLFAVSLALLIVGIAVKGAFWLALIGIVLVLLSIGYGVVVAPRG